MAVTLAGLVTRIRETVEGAEPRNRPYQAALTSGAGPGVTTLSVPDGDAWQAGDLAETPDGELCLVTAVATNDLTVIREYGTVATGTLSSGDIVKKNPRFTYDQIVTAINSILEELDDRLFNLKNEDIAVTTGDWYDMTDTTAEEVFSVWFIEDGEFRVPLFSFVTDPANNQPQVFIAATGYTGTVHVNYRAPYAAVTELPDRLRSMMVAGAVYKLLGGALVTSSSDPGKRTDRTMQSGQEGRDSYWFFREFVRLRDAEVASQRERIARLPSDRMSQRMRRFRK